MQVIDASATSEHPSIRDADDPDELPEGWVACAMGDVSKIVGGGTPKADEQSNFADDGYAWITPADLTHHRDRYIERGRRSLSEAGLRGSSAVMLPPGAVLFSSRAPIGHVVIGREAVSTNQGFRSFIPSEGVLSEYLYYYLRFAKPLAEALASGTTFAEISGSNCARIPLRLPPTSEQRRIAEAVETLLARVEAGRARLDRVPAILRRFRQAVLAAACSGRLTEDWRAARTENESVDAFLTRIFRERRARSEREIREARNQKRRLPRALQNLERQQVDFSGLSHLPANWCWATWNDLTDWVTYGFTRPMPHVPEGIPIITAKNVLNSGIDFSTADHTTPDAYRLLSEKDRPRVGEILLTKDGSIGRAAIVETDQAFCVNQSVAVLRFGGLTADVGYLLRVIQSELTQSMIEEGAEGTAIRHISITDFGRFPVPVPPLQEQREIERRVESLFTLADAVERRVATARAQADAMPQAILARAFSGRLVPTEAELARHEGRDYEPGSALLERIGRERAESPLRPRSRRRH